MLQGIGLILGLWYIAAVVIDHPVIPLPHIVIARFVTALSTQELYIHLFASIGRVFLGSIIAIAIGLPLGIITGINKKANAIISPILYLLYPLPKIAFLPVFMVLLGIGNLSKISLIATIILFPTAIAIRDGIQEIHNEYFMLQRAFHLSQKEVYKHILLPGIIPRLFSSLRITLGISLSVLFISENFATTTGLGYYIMNNWVMANYIGMYVGIMALGLLGLFLYVCLEVIEYWVIPYRKETP